MSMGDFLDEVKYTLDGVGEILQDIAYIVKNLPSIFSRQGKIKKLYRYFAENLPERFTKSSQYSINIIWDMGMFIGDITLHITEDGVYNAQVNDEEMRMRAKQIVADFLPDVSNPPFAIRAMFTVTYPNSTGGTVNLMAHTEKLPRANENT